MFHLENVHMSGDTNRIDCRFPVQHVIRSQDQDTPYRGYGGRIASGVFRTGDKVMVLPSGFTTRIRSIDSFEGELSEAFAPMSVSMRMEDEIDISRGDMIVRENNMTQVGQDIDMMICWLHERELKTGGRYILRHTTREVHCQVKEIYYKIDINTLRRLQKDKIFQMNDIGRIQVRTTQPLFYDSYRRNRTTGSLILIDETSNETVGAGMII